MKQIKFLMIVSAGIFALLFTSCENQDVEFPDFDYSTVYFAYQYPVRTIVLGEDIIDNTLDNEHKCEIYATMGGVYANDQTIGIDVTVDNSLVSNLYFDTEFTMPVEAMPSNYYSLAADKIYLDQTMSDGVEVQLTEAFFADPNALSNSYVIPLRMTNVVNADSILSGVAKFDGAVRGKDTDWDILPKDYVLYCVKFINPWHGNYLRRGEDVITEGGETSTVTRGAEYVEDDELVALSTASLNTVEFPVTLVGENGVNVTCTLLLTFDDQNACTISSATEGFTASGSGSFVVDGEKNSWGNKDRNALYLDYTIDMGSKSYATTDILVVRDRGVAMETFSPSYNVN